MKFGKRLRTQVEDTLPEWRSKFLCYKELKKRLKSVAGPDFFARASCSEGSAADAQPGCCNGVLPEKDTDKCGKPEMVCDGCQDRKRSPPRVVPEEEEFVRMVNVELEKLNNFFIEKEEEFVIRLQDFKERVAALQAKCGPNVAVTTCMACEEEVNDIQRQLVAFHGEMVLLENYSSLNYTGLVKILKKHDKRTGLLLRMPFINSALRQPFYTTELLSKLVLQCEENMQSVFGMQAGIGMEANSTCRVRCESNANGCSVAPRPPPIPAPEGPPADPLGMVTVEEIRHCILAALKTLQDLRTQVSVAVTGCSDANGRADQLIAADLARSDSSEEEGTSKGDAGFHHRGKRARKEDTGYARVGTDGAELGREDLDDAVESGQKAQPEEWPEQRPQTGECPKPGNCPEQRAASGRCPVQGAGLGECPDKVAVGGCLAQQGVQGGCCGQARCGPESVGPKAGKGFVPRRGGQGGPPSSSKSCGRWPPERGPLARTAQSGEESGAETADLQFVK